MNFNRLGHRLGASYAALLAVMLGAAAVAGLQMRAIGAAHATLEQDRQLLSVVGEWTTIVRSNLDRAITATRLDAAGGDDDAIRQRLAPLADRLSLEMGESAGAADQALKRMNALSGAGDDVLKPLVAQVNDDRARFVGMRAKIRDDLLLGEGVEQIDRQLLPLAQAMNASLDRLQAAIHARSAGSSQALGDRLDSALTTLLGSCALALVAGVVLAWRTARSITRPLARATSFAGTIAERDLSAPLVSAHAVRNDELGKMMRGLEHMRVQLQQSLHTVNESTQSIGTASVQIAAGNQDLSQRTEQAAASLQQTASAMQQLSSAVSSSADSAAQANQLAASASSVARRGGSVVAEVVSTMEDIQASSRRIADIIVTIDGIAFQTNILALNAAVEAARAGEQGRGFAVVASEVRNLAQRSAAAAKEIKALIGASVDKVQAGTRLVGDAGSTMNEIVASVQRVTDVIGEISAATAEQHRGLGQVNTAVGRLDQMTQQNAALVEQAAAAAESLKGQALRLAAVVADFRLGGQGAVATMQVAALPAPASMASPAAATAPKPV